MTAKKHPYSKKRRSYKPPKLVVAFGVLILLAVLTIFILELTNTTHFFHKKHVPAIIPLSVEKNPSTHTNTSAPSNSSSSSPGASTPASPTKEIPSGSGGGTSASLTQPYGTFVNNHAPGQNGTDTREESVCSTTPGASCYIQFTSKDGTITKLPSQITGNDGSTTWSWNANILRSGEWQITAIATLNSETKTASDGIPLEIQ